VRCILLTVERWKLATSFSWCWNCAILVGVLECTFGLKIKPLNTLISSKDFTLSLSELANQLCTYLAESTYLKESTDLAESVVYQVNHMTALTGCAHHTQTPSWVAHPVVSCAAHFLCVLLLQAVGESTHEGFVCSLYFRSDRFQRWSGQDTKQD
jgi:hypothetical protein